MEKVNQILNQTFTQTSQRYRECAEDEFIKPNGIKYCKKCGTAREFKLELCGKERIMPAVCDCQRKSNEKEYERQDAIERQIKLDRLKGYSLMDKLFEDCTFEKWDVEKYPHTLKKLKMAKKYVDQWHTVKDENIGLIIHGNAGVGKSFMSYCIANALLQRMIPVICISMIGILSKIKDGYNSHGDNGEYAVLNTLNNADLLIIDDLGAERITDWSRKILYSLIDSRVRANKPLIITTNLNDEAIKQAYDTDGSNRTYDRIRKSCLFVGYDGESKRYESTKTKYAIFSDLLKE